jgi:hypothetical protein
MTIQRHDLLHRVLRAFFLAQQKLKENSEHAKAHSYYSMPFVNNSPSAKNSSPPRKRQKGICWEIACLIKGLSVYE